MTPEETKAFDEFKKRYSVKPDLGLKTRMSVLSSALFIEELIARFLGGMLGINDTSGTISLGNKNTSLSFNQKVNLLIDIGAIEKDNRKKFQLFMEIRNQFMHNMAAKSYEACFSFLDGSATFLLKSYPQKATLSNEKQLEQAVLDLAVEITKLSMNITKQITEKHKIIVEHETNKMMLDALLESVNKVTAQVNGTFESMIKNKKKISAKALAGFGTNISKLIQLNTQKKFNQKVKEAKKPWE